MSKEKAQERKSAPSPNLSPLLQCKLNSITSSGCKPSKISLLVDDKINRTRSWDRALARACNAAMELLGACFDPEFWKRSLLSVVRSRGQEVGR